MMLVSLVNLTCSTCCSRQSVISHFLSHIPVDALFYWATALNCASDVTLDGACSAIPTLNNCGFYEYAWNVSHASCVSVSS